MVTISTAEKALKSLYLDVVANQLNTRVNPFLGKVEKSTADVWGRNIIKLVPYGINGGIGAGGESDNLPAAANNMYLQFTSTLKNLYGTIELSDKAIRASSNSAGAFVSLLNAEMEGLLNASKFNFSRMLYGNGSGKLASTVDNTGNADRSIVKLSNVKNVIEGMMIDFYLNGQSTSYLTRRIVYVDRSANTIKLDSSAAEVIGAGSFITLQNSKDKELTGLENIFDTSSSIYGVNRSSYKFLNPYVRTSAGAISSAMIQGALDYIDETAGSDVDYISASYDVRRNYIDYLALSRTNVDYLNLDGGFKAIAYNGIPFVADRFVADGTMYLLNSNDFKIHQLCDWRWLEGENGKILMQKSGTPSYTATLVKYADLICERPGAQAKITGITGQQA